MPRHPGATSAYVPRQHMCHVTIHATSVRMACLWCARSAWVTRHHVCQVSTGCVPVWHPLTPAESADGGWWRCGYADRGSLGFYPKTQKGWEVWGFVCRLLPTSAEFRKMKYWLIPLASYILILPNFAAFNHVLLYAEICRTLPAYVDFYHAS